MEVITTDPDARGDDFPICSSSLDQQSEQQFLIQSAEYLQGFKEKMLGEQIEKYE